MRIPALVLALLLAVAVTGPARAETVAEVELAWRDWMTRSNRSAGGLAVMRGGRLVHEATMGREQAGVAVPLASLSKAVTGVCVAGLVERGRLAFDTPLSQALARTFARLGAPADPRMPDVTIGQLLVHRAGFDRSEGGDPVTGRLGAYLRSATATRPSIDEQMAWVLRRRLPLAPGERFAYTNAAYLVLGAVIEEASGQDYEGHCRNTVLTPLGVRAAALNPAWRILASYGGWRMPLADYGRFYQAFALGNPAIGPVARAWMMSPDLISTGGKTLGGGAHYGLGTFVRPTSNGGGNFWHAGKSVYDLPAAFDGPLKLSFSSYALRLGALDVDIVLHVRPALGEDASFGELDRALGEAARGVTRWP